MSHTSNHIHCDLCGTLTETKIRKINRRWAGQVFEIPAETETCPKCDNYYLHRKAIDKVDELLDEIVATV